MTTNSAILRRSWVGKSRCTTIKRPFQYGHYSGSRHINRNNGPCPSPQPACKPQAIPKEIIEPARSECDFNQIGMLP